MILKKCEKISWSRRGTEGRWVFRGALVGTLHHGSTGDSYHTDALTSS